MDRISAWEIADARSERFARQAEDEYWDRVNDYTDDLS
jgi:hypothetical protein